MKSPQAIVFVLVVLGVAGFIGYQMYYSMAPPRHADHDHAISSLDASGFLRVKAIDGSKRNLVGRPEHVLILHFFDPLRPPMEQAQAARFAQRFAEDPSVEMIFIGRADSWDDLEPWAEKVGVPTDILYLDKKGDTAVKCGVKRWPETLIFAPNGALAFQASGSVDWNAPGILSQISRAKSGAQPTH
jgi:hypothetical protein